MEDQTDPTIQTKYENRIKRYFVGRQGYIYILWEITEIPEKSDNPDYDAILRSSYGFPTKDGMLGMMHVSTHFTLDGVEQDIKRSKAFVEHFVDITEMAPIFFF